MMIRHLGQTLFILVISATLASPVRSVCGAAPSSESVEKSVDGTLDRSPVDLVLSPDGGWIVTVNETSDSVSLIRTSDRKVVSEIAVGTHPANAAVTPDGSRVLVTSAWSGTLDVLRFDNGSLVSEGKISIGMQPWGIAVAPDGSKAFVGLVASGEVAEVDLLSRQVTRKFAVGNWPRYLSLTPDGKRLAVGCGGDSEIAVVDVATGKTLYSEPLSGGINLGQMLTSSDGKYVYFPWMVYRTNPINVRNIQLGWVLASRMGRVRLDGSSYREAVSLDVPGLAVADSHDLVITGDGNRLVASSSGTHELLVYRLPDMPFIAEGGPGDLIDPQLQHNPDRFDRIEVGGRPMGMAIAKDDRTVYVANYLRNSVQVVDIESRELVQEISLGGPTEKSPARKGMEIFYDAERSLDQWYSCHTCHPNGGVNSRAMDTHNDGSEMSFKSVLPLQNVTSTGPWTWHGWQTDLSDAMGRSVTSTMQGHAPEAKDKEALVAFLGTLEHPPNPFRISGGSPDGPHDAPRNGAISEAALRGEAIFRSDRAACVQCHSGPLLTDGEVHDVGTGSKTDAYDGYNTPSLVATYAKVRWLHSGRAKSLLDVVTDLHSPDKVSGTKPLSEDEAADLVAYLKSL